jgi:nanoRNase/pAp phosphatase (c-di-AMP/oligoRNAs hydrolase)
MSVTIATKVEQYIKLRDYKQSADDEYKKSMERVAQAMKKLEGELLEHLNTQSIDNIAAKGVGTVYRTTRTSASVEDAVKFMDWVKEHEKWDALDVKANKTFVTEMIAAENDTPPGVKVSSVQTIGVRRS